MNPGARCRADRPCLEGSESRNRLRDVLAWPVFFLVAPAAGRFRGELTSVNLGKSGVGRRGLPLSAAAILATAILVGCGSGSSTGPKPAGPTTYQGTFAGGTGENGVVTIVVPAATPAPPLSYSGPRTNAPLGSASSAVNVTGTLTVVGAGTVNLPGTFH